MCGRFILDADWQRLVRLLTLTRDRDRGRNQPARYNIAPTQDVPFAADVDGQRRLFDGRWWLVPHWATELPKWALFNARSEDAERKPAFRDAFRSRRCAIPASGYYEWTRAADGGKDPHLIHLPGREPFAFAGLWAYNEALDVTSCAILTAPADPAIERLHHRMPVVLQNDAIDAWLEPHADVATAKAQLERHRGGELQSYRVARAVNGSRASGPELIEPLGDDGG